MEFKVILNERIHFLPPLKMLSYCLSVQFAASQDGIDTHGANIII